MGFFSNLKEAVKEMDAEQEQREAEKRKHLKFPKHPADLHIIGHVTDLYGDPDMDKVLASSAPTLTGMLEEVYTHQAKYEQYHELEGRYNELQKHYDELQKRYDELVQTMAANQAALAQR